MRVLFVLGEFPLLSQTFVLDQVTGLVELGVDVAIVAEKPRVEAPVHADFERYALAAKTSYFPNRLGEAGFGRWLRAAPLSFSHALWRSLLPDVSQARGWAPLGRAAAARDLGAVDAIVAHFGPNGLRALSLRQLGVSQAPIATVFHGYDVSVWPRERGIERYQPLFDQGELMLPISNLFRDRLIEFGCPSAKISVQRVGIDTDKLCFRPRPATSDQHGEFNLLSVGRLVEKKGFEYVLRALAHPSLESQKLRYHLVGDGPLRAPLEDLARQLGILERVVFHGGQPRERVSQLYERADTMLVPSVTAADGNQEGLPVALMEAMAVGMPVVATQHSGIPELVIDSETGLLVPERDPDALALALSRLIRDDALRGRLVLAARDKVQAQHSLDSVNRELVEKLAALVERARPSRSSAQG